MTYRKHKLLILIDIVWSLLLVVLVFGIATHTMSLSYAYVVFALFCVALTIKICTQEIIEHLDKLQGGEHDPNRERRNDSIHPEG